MATLLLSTVGSALGSSIGGTLLGVSAATIGQTAGGVLGAYIDNRLLGPGAQSVEGPRLDKILLSTAHEGAALPRLWGRMRVPGQIIWASRYRESVETQSQGGKGGASAVTTTYSYSVSFAVALCEGPIARLGRVWADGAEIALSDLPHRLYLGTEDQLPDSAITAIEGEASAPAYRGTAYLVFEDLPLAQFGNRIPQLSFEVFRRPPAPQDAPPRLESLARGVALTPGTGEFTLATTPVRRQIREGVVETENAHDSAGTADLIRSLDALQAALPHVESISLVIAWFGTDLRCDICEIRPGIERRDRITEPLTWRVSNTDRSAAWLVSTDADGNPNFGGTPDDTSVIEAIREIKARGLKVLIYPFILMDIPGGNALPDPWDATAAEQPAFPWRGRITLSAAPGEAGSPDQTSAAAEQVAAFFGTAEPGHFAATSTGVAYSGPAEWRYRRQILHLANLALAAGGVDAFAIGSELRSLTQIRSGPQSYPAVDALITLAEDLRSVLGPETLLTYAADWSEYFGHQPGDGSGDVFFHLDPLWASPAIDAIGIDAYFPLTDHRPGSDPSAAITDIETLQAGIEGGEGYEWYYASAQDRDARIRTPIIDTAHGEHWIFRPKDLRSWWLNPHHNRPGGVRSASPTAWVPGSKPIWLTELGFPAVDTGPNQPNVFVDPKSSESNLPHYSRGLRDDFVQRRALEAVLRYWKGEANPLSPLTGAPMIETAATHIWTWDARPWPDFPGRAKLWRDAANYALGHWISGRTDSIPLADLVAELCLAAGLSASDFDASALIGTVDGLIAERLLSTREILQPLMLTYGFDAAESGGQIRFVMRGSTPIEALATERLVVNEGEDEIAAPLTLTREDPQSLPSALQLTYREGLATYEPASLQTRIEHPTKLKSASELPLVLSQSAATQTAERWLMETHTAATGAEFALPPSALRLEPTDVIRLVEQDKSHMLRLSRIEDAGARRIEAVRTDPSLYERAPRPDTLSLPSGTATLAPPELILLDLPLLNDEARPHAPWLAAALSPWPGGVDVYRSDRDEAYTFDASLERPATIGRTTTALAAADPDRWSAQSLDIRLSTGVLESRTREAVLNGANLAALQTPSGAWEVMQYAGAELIGPNTYRLTDLLRGQGGTEADIAASLPIGSRFILLDSALVQSTLPASALGLERHYRAVPKGRALTPELSTHRLHSATGLGLRPYAPTHLRAALSAESLTLTWTRRTRLGGDPWEPPQVPLSEETERYSVSLTGPSPQTLTTTAPEVTIPSNTLAPGDYTITVAQTSTTIGDGPSTSLLLTVP